MYRNSSGYSNPTEGAVMAKMMAEYKAEQRKIRARQDEIKSRPKVYVASRYAGDIAGNVQAAKKYCRYVVSQRRIPVASHLIYPRFLDDSDKKERELGTMFGLALLAICDEVWVFGKKYVQWKHPDRQHDLHGNSFGAELRGTDADLADGHKSGRNRALLVGHLRAEQIQSNADD